MMRDEKKYNPQGGSLLPRTITQGRLRYTCQPCAIESITPMGYGHTVRLAWAIECTMDNDTPQCLMEIGRGGACVPTRVAPQGRIHRSSPAHNACIFGMETPLRGRSGGHTGAAPTVSFGRIACGTVDFVWAVDFVCWITRGCLASFLHYSARMPLRILFFMLFISVAFIFSMDSDEGIQKNGIFVPSL